MPDIPHDHPHSILKSIQHSVSHRQFSQMRLDFQSENRTDSSRMEKDETNDPAPGPKIHHPVARLDRHKLRKKHRVDGEPVAFLGLDQTQPATH
jgi:hypothetical protein